MRKVEHGLFWVLTIQAAISAMVLLACGIAGEIARSRETDLPFGLILLPLLALLAWLVLVAPRRRYNALGYALEGEDLRIASGVLTRTETLVPLRRVQHIDVSQGPLERVFGITRLVLHTAGTMNSLVVLPGLARPTAEAIRDEIRARIGQDDE